MNGFDVKVVENVEAELWPPDPDGPEDAALDREPDLVARATSITIAALGGLAVVTATGAVLSALFVPAVNAALASPVAATLAAGLVLVTYVSGLGLLGSGALLHHTIHARRLTALTYEGLVEETSQEFDKVSARLERLEDAFAHLDSRSVRRAPRADATAREAPSGLSSPGPVRVNVLQGGSRQDASDAER